MMQVTIDSAGRVGLGGRLLVSFHRTLRIPDDGRSYPLPPGFGLFPIRPCRDAAPGLAADLVIPLYQREAMWIGFAAAPWKPNAVKVIVGGINAVTGIPDDAAELGAAQDYLVCPPQPWLDGFNEGGGVIRQFVAMPLGRGYAIEAGAGRPEAGGAEIVAFEPYPGRFPEAAPARPGPTRLSRPILDRAEEPRELALGAGGQMRQKIYPDPHGRDAWNPADSARVTIRLVDSAGWEVLTGEAPPATPIDATAYTRAGLPWFDLYDEGEGTLDVDRRRRRKTVAERDRELGIEPDAPGESLDVTRVTGIARKKDED
jgi:hypothetical protein